jgi:selenide,water dikinase
MTALAREGGSGGALAPAVLRAILAELPAVELLPGLRAGIETGVALHRLDAERALIASTELIAPLVDDPYEFGRIAATHALSGLYAMGGAPIQALTTGGLPSGKLPPASIQRILAGSAAVCAQAGILVADGPFADTPEPLCGLVALGLVHPDRALRHGNAQAGDALILTKALGIGVFGAAFRRGALGAEEYGTLIEAATQPNAVGGQLPGVAGVHAVAAMGAAGLLGQTLEICREARLSAVIRLKDVPLLPGAQTLVQAGVETAAAIRNWDGYGRTVQLVPRSPSWVRTILCDPQTGGGLLIAAAAEAVDPVMALLRQAGFGQAAIVGRLRPGPVRLHVS